MGASDTGFAVLGYFDNQLGCHLRLVLGLVFVLCLEASDPDGQDSINTINRIVIASSLLEGFYD